jgi:hypothetical protein
LFPALPSHFGAILFGFSIPHFYLQANHHLSQATILIKTRIARLHHLPRPLTRILLVEVSAMPPKSRAKLVAVPLPILVEAVV